MNLEKRQGHEMKINFLSSNTKHMLWVLKRTVSMRQFLWAPKTYVKIDQLENIHNFTTKSFIYGDKYTYVPLTRSVIASETPSSPARE